MKQLLENAPIATIEMIHSSFNIPLPEYLSTLNEFMCGNSLNRTGELCGTCKSNFTVPLFM